MQYPLNSSSLRMCLELVSLRVAASRSITYQGENFISSSAFPISSRASLAGGVGLALGIIEIDSGLFPYRALSDGAKEEDPYLKNCTGAGTMDSMSTLDRRSTSQSCSTARS